MKALNLVGEKFGRLSVISSCKISQYTGWICRCDCGNITQAYTNSLRTGNTKSCGCLQKERTSIARKKHGMSGVCKTAEYNTWLCMRNRCRTNPLYSGRGVKVCNRWNDFDNFLKDMGPRPTPYHSIERRDNNGDYCPENCSWETSKTQSRNKRNNITITHNGKTMIARDWDAELGFRPGTVTGRLYLGWTKQRAVTQKLKHRSKRN
jgi:hypothetical protein